MSYLRFATKARPVVTADAVCEQLVYGTNLAISPDAYFAAVAETEIPGARLNNPLQYPGYVTPFSPSKFSISDANPDVGTYHVRADLSSGSTLLMVIYYAEDCPEILGYSARVEPGDTVTFSVRAMRSEGSGSIEPALQMVFIEEGPSYADVEVNEYRGEDFDGDVAGSYTTYQVAEVAPAGSYFVNCFIGAKAAIGASGIVDFDSFSIVVTPA